MKTVNSFTAWAIKTDYVDKDGKEYPGFIGRYWFCVPIPCQIEGCHYSLFKHRAIARRYLPEVRNAFPDAKIVKVNVNVSESKK